eukprot:GFUD01044034.1.p1 GENE.GFUD01044034.1~~GFUD01044034.1.p1  ORF type:complete len:328 (+),score=70.64 GFUD01044034.1:51-1034(+)
MSPLYSGSADEWSYLSNTSASSAVTMEFVIDEFKTQMNNRTTLKSHQFTVKDTLWHVGVTPGKDKHLGVFIYNDNKEDLNVICKFEVGDTVSKLDDGANVVNNSNLGFPKFLSHEKCLEVLSDGKLIVEVEMKVLEKEGTLIHGKGKHCNAIPDTISVLLKMYEDKDFTDFSVVCNGKPFLCHKAILAARSPVFKAMMESNMKEANDAIVELKNCTEVVAKSFVKFFYTGQVDEEVLKENAASFLDLSEEYDLQGLKAIAEQVMIANLDKENMVSCYLAGVLYHGQKIRAAAKTFLMQNRRSLTEQEGWREAFKGREELVFELMETF